MKGIQTEAYARDGLQKFLRNLSVNTQATGDTVITDADSLAMYPTLSGNQIR